MRRRNRLEAEAKKQEMMGSVQNSQLPFNAEMVLAQFHARIEKDNDADRIGKDLKAIFDYDNETGKQAEKWYQLQIQSLDCKIKDKLQEMNAIRSRLLTKKEELLPIYEEGDSF